jgi:CRP-like cAMP-binding protein
VKTDGFSKLVATHGDTEIHTAGQVFHAQDFPDKLFLLKKGYVKRYQATNPEQKVLELIYGPGHIISLSQLYKLLFGVDQNQEGFIYIYQAMTDVELQSISVRRVMDELESNPSLYKDFFYEAGLKLRSNIFRLSSNALKDDYKKVAHQLVSLVYEFAKIEEGDSRQPIRLPLPQSAVDIAEQLNISKEVAEAVLNSLETRKLIQLDGGHIVILDINLLKDLYL